MASTKARTSGLRQSVCLHHNWARGLRNSRPVLVEGGNPVDPTLVWRLESGAIRIRKDQRLRIPRNHKSLKGSLLIQPDTSSVIR